MIMMMMMMLLLLRVTMADAAHQDAPPWWWWCRCEVSCPRLLLGRLGRGRRDFGTRRGRLKQGPGSSGWLTRFRFRFGPRASSREGAPCAAVSQPAPSFPATAGPQDLDLRPSPGPWRWDEGAHAGSQSQLTPGGCQRCSWKPRPAGCNSRRRLAAADDGTWPGWTKW